MGIYLSSSTAHSFLAGAFSRPSFWLGIAMWALGFAGNILHDEILLQIRRNVKKKTDDGKEHYAIPYGYLYRYISYPNYFCEWFEWLGFAIAAAPFPGLQLTNAAPPWLFFLSEIFLMAPRAVQGHAWYHKKFKNYPKERKAVVPFVL
jgi:3-oxo-5-alpha-steroid 4-dehydrogenase 1